MENYNISTSGMFKTPKINVCLIKKKYSVIVIKNSDRKITILRLDLSNFV